MTENEENLKALALELRDWDAKWDKYYDESPLGLNKPKNLDELIPELSKKYKLEIR